MNAQWLFVFSTEVSHNATLRSCYRPWALVKSLLSLWPRWKCSRREKFTLSILSVFLVQFIPLLMFLGSNWPCGLATCGRNPSGQQARLRCFSQHVLSSLAWPSQALSLQSVAFIALGAGSYLGALSVGDPLVTLLEGLIRHSKQNPGAQRPNSAPGTTTSWTVKVICHILSQRFNFPRVCWVDYSIFKGTRCSCTVFGLIVTLGICIYAGRLHFQCIRKHAYIHTFFLEVSPSLVQFDSVD